MTSRVRATIAMALGAAALAPAAVPLHAWGAVGHHVVARIAWARLSPPARQAVTALLGGNLEFVDSATWADDVRSARPETYNWHFVDIPVGQKKYDPARDCPPTDKGDCVIAEIERARKELVDARRPDALKAESLKFLIHFVGDLHQPLHAVDNHDRGGNDVKVDALRGEDGRGTNLHAVWDTGLINLSTETESARATRLLADLSQHPVDATLDPIKWAEESHDLAERVAYRYPGFSSSGPPATPIALDQEYRNAAIALIDRQMLTAGVRLGVMIDALLGRR